MEILEMKKLTDKIEDFKLMKKIILILPSLALAGILLSTGTNNKDKQIIPNKEPIKTVYNLEKKLDNLSQNISYYSNYDSLYEDAKSIVTIIEKRNYLIKNPQYAVQKKIMETETKKENKKGNYELLFGFGFLGFSIYNYGKILVELHNDLIKK